MTFLRLKIYCLSIFLLMAAGLGASASTTVTVTYPASTREIINPYIGNVAWANSQSQREQPFTLIYANLLWGDFEPTQGEYDFESFEELNHFAKWRQEGKKAIIRFVMDVPGSKSHMDIPNWLWKKTGKDGQSYNISYGRGYNPNYANPVLIEFHEKAITALGEHYGQDPFIAFVQLGSLGHWGEWHVSSKLHPLPLEPIRDLYVLPYLDAFPNAQLLMRRPFAIASKHKIGLYNDTTGSLESTQTWLNWIEEGGIYDQTQEESALVPMPDAWIHAPVGGELSTRYKHIEFLEEEMLGQTLALFELSHTSWIGPRSFVDVDRDGEYQKAIDQVNQKIGYRLRVAKSEITQTDDGQVSLLLTWENSAIAPFYFDWQPSLQILAGDGKSVILPLDLNVEDIKPGQPVQTEIMIGKETVPAGSYTVYAGIVNPQSGDAEIELAMDTEHEDKWYELFRISNN